MIYDIENILVLEFDFEIIQRTNKVIDNLQAIKNYQLISTDIAIKERNDSAILYG